MYNEDISSKAYLESESSIFDTSMSAKEAVKPLSSQEKPLQMEAFGKMAYSEDALRIAEPVHFEKPSALPFVEEFVSKPSREDRVEVKKQSELSLKGEPKKTEDLHSQQKPKESVQVFDKVVHFSKASEIEDTISKPAPPTKGADVVISSSTGKKQPPAPAAIGVCNFKMPDVNLFPLPASSAPLIQSFADNVMDLQQPSSTQSDGKEDLSSLLFESTATLPYLSPLSADYPKEHTSTIAFSADSTTPETLQNYATETELFEGKDNQSMFGLGGMKEDAIFSDRGLAVEHPTSQQEYILADHDKMYTQSAKEMFSGMLKSVVPPHEEFSDHKEGVEHYVDFKPFVSTGGLDLGYEFIEKTADVKSDLSHLDFESTKLRRKWTEDSPNIKVGDVVLLKSEQESRNEWPVGLVVNTLPSRDGKVRKVEVKVTKNRLPEFILDPSLTL